MGEPLKVNNQHGDEAPKPSLVEAAELKGQSPVEGDMTSSLEQNVQFFLRAPSEPRKS